MCSVRKVHRTARIALRTTPAQRRRCYALLRSAGDVWAWVLDCNRALREWHCPQVAKFPALCRELTGTSFGELSRTCAEDVLKSYSTAFFEAARRKKARVRAGFPRRKRGLVPVRFHLRPFVLGDDTLHLGEQPGLGIVIKGGGVREQHRHTVAGQLVEHDHLVGVDPGEAIRRQAPYGVEEPRLGRVTKSIEVGAIQAGTGVPVIDELCDQLVALGIGPLTQRGDLGADGAPGFLGLGRDPCIDGHSHRHASSLITVSSPGKASSSS
jgi:hypothetical protein